MYPRSSGDSPVLVHGLEPAPVLVQGLNADELHSLRALLAARNRELAAAETFAGKVSKFLQSNLGSILKAAFTIGVAVLIGYFTLSGKVQDATHQVDLLAVQVNAQQTTVGAVQTSVQALQAPVQQLVSIVNLLNIAALQANISRAEQMQSTITATNLQLQADLATGQSNLGALQSQLAQNAVLQTVLNLNATAVAQAALSRLLVQAIQPTMAAWDGSWQTVRFATVQIDTHAAYDASTGVFTPPASGVYSIEACFQAQGYAASPVPQSIWMLYTSAGVERAHDVNLVGADMQTCFRIACKLAAGQSAHLQHSMQSTSGLVPFTNNGNTVYEYMAITWMHAY